MKPFWIAAILVSGCVELQTEATPDAGAAVIEVASGGFHGSSSTSVFAGDVLVTTTSAPAGMGKPDTRTVVQGAPGTFDRVASVFAAKAPAAKAVIKPKELLCMDYGTDLVRATPPIAGIDQITAACPDDAMAALMADLLTAMAAPE